MLIGSKSFLITLLEMIFDRNPISFNIEKHASVLNPKFLLLQPLDVCKAVMQRLLFTLDQLKMICSSQGDQALSEFSSSTPPA